MSKPIKNTPILERKDKIKFLVIEKIEQYPNSDLIDGTEIEEETAFLLEYNKSIKSHYKNQKKPFEL